MMGRPAEQSKKAALASYEISFLLCKKGKPFLDGELVKDRIALDKISFVNWKIQCKLLTWIIISWLVSLKMALQQWLVLDLVLLVLHNTPTEPLCQASANGICYEYREARCQLY